VSGGPGRQTEGDRDREKHRMRLKVLLRQECLGGKKNHLSTSKRLNADGGTVTTDVPEDPG